MVLRSGAACASGTADKARSNAERIMDRAPAVVDKVRRAGAPEVPEIIVGFASRQKSSVNKPGPRSTRHATRSTQLTSLLRDYFSVRRLSVGCGFRPAALAALLASLSGANRASVALLPSSRKLF